MRKAPDTRPEASHTVSIFFFKIKGGELGDLTLQRHSLCLSFVCPPRNNRPRGNNIRNGSWLFSLHIRSYMKVIKTKLLLFLWIVYHQIIINLHFSSVPVKRCSVHQEWKLESLIVADSPSSKSAHRNTEKKTHHPAIWLNNFNIPGPVIMKFIILIYNRCFLEYTKIYWEKHHPEF